MSHPEKRRPAAVAPAPIAELAAAPIASAVDATPPAPIAPVIDAPAAEADAPAIDAGGPIEARVLLAFDGRVPDDIIIASAEEIAALAGLVDPHPEAVAYAKSLG